jgi:hypothetical protein
MASHPSDERQPKPKLPLIGTKVTVFVDDDTVYGVVEDYEHQPNQTMFPVKFGWRTRIMTADHVTPLPDDQQPDDRQPPRCTSLIPCHCTRAGQWDGR